MVSNLAKADKKSEKRTKRNPDEIAIEKINNSVKVTLRQFEKLEKARRNVIKSGNDDLAKRFNFIINSMINQLDSMSISPEMMKEGFGKAKKETEFNIMDIPIVDE